MRQLDRSGHVVPAFAMRSLELFSGAGGLALGLEAAGFDNIALFERNKDACVTLRNNRPAWNVGEGDVRDVDYSKFKNVDLVAGGPPCQPFSMGGKARGSDDRRDLFPEAARAVRELKPSAFIFENVRGLLRPAFAGYVEFIRLQLRFPDFPISLNADWETNWRRLQRFANSAASKSATEYEVSVNLVDAANYGVPQRRHRVFIVGFRKNLNLGWSMPPVTHTKEALEHAKQLSQSYWLDHGLKSKKSFKSVQPEEDLFGAASRWRTVRDAIASLNESSCKIAWINHKKQPGARSYPGHTGSPMDEPAKALKAGDHGVPGGENMLRTLDGTVRYFTVREAARIQTFPDDWFFPVSWTESMRQLGNAVPVELARIVAASIASKIRSHVRSKNLQST